jgi:hypothetical protein
MRKQPKRSLYLLLTSNKHQLAFGQASTGIPQKPPLLAIKYAKVKKM